MPEKTSAERALQGQAEDDGENARRGDQGADGRVEDIGNDRQRGAEIDHADDEILYQAALARPSLEDQEHAGGAVSTQAALTHQMILARATKMRSNDRRIAGRNLIGNDVVVEQQHRQRHEEASWKIRRLRG